MSPGGWGWFAHLSSSFHGTEKNHSAGENTVGTHRALRNMDKAIEPRSVSFQFPGAPFSMGSNPPRTFFLLSPPPPLTALHLRRHSNLFSAAGWHALRPNSLSQDSLPYIFPFRYSVPLSFSLSLSSPLVFSRYLILFIYIYIYILIFFQFNISPFPRTIYILTLLKYSYKLSSSKMRF